MAVNFNQGAHGLVFGSKEHMLDELIVMFMIYKSTKNVAADGITTTGSYALHFLSIVVIGYLWSQDAMG